MTKRKIIIGLMMLFIVTSITSCAPENHSSHEYGFFGGIWHGITWFFALIGTLFGADIGLYAGNNTGFTYWLGFIIGLVGLGGGGASTRG
jgi:hypothetical protein